MKTLRDRCLEFYQKMSRDKMLRQGNPVDDLMAFVIAETGRTADKSLEEALPLCLYFGSAVERDEFIDAVREAKPNMITKTMP